jgi:hypothetical protein
MWALAALVFLWVGIYAPTINQATRLTPLSITRFLVIGAVAAAVLGLELKNCQFSTVNKGLLQKEKSQKAIQGKL